MSELEQGIAPGALMRNSSQTKAKAQRHGDDQGMIEIERVAGHAVQRRLDRALIGFHQP